MNNCEIPQHIGILMDGNRKWATARGLSKKEGHSTGAEVFKKIAVDCANLNIKYLTTYMFSLENWNRSKEEVNNLLEILLDIFYDYEYFVKNNIRVRIIGSRKGLDSSIISCIKTIESETSACSRMNLSIAFNYGGRNEIVEALDSILMNMKKENMYRSVTEKIINQHMQSKELPEVDLIIRTSGVKRLSTFLLWKTSYSEIIFIDKYWPDFTKEDLIDCISVYNKKKRRCER